MGARNNPLFQRVLVMEVSSSFYGKKKYCTVLYNSSGCRLPVFINSKTELGHAAVRSYCVKLLRTLLVLSKDRQTDATATKTGQMKNDGADPFS